MSEMRQLLGSPTHLSLSVVWLQLDRLGGSAAQRQARASCQGDRYAHLRAAGDARSGHNHTGLERIAQTHGPACSQARYESTSVTVGVACVFGFGAGQDSCACWAGCHVIRPTKPSEKERLSEPLESGQKEMRALPVAAFNITGSIAHALGDRRGQRHGLAHDDAGLIGTVAHSACHWSCSICTDAEAAQIFGRLERSLW